MQPITVSSRQRWLAAAVFAVLVLLGFGPFLSRAYHIDDPLFVWAARHIAEHPGDFFGFPVLWYDTWEPMWQVTQNPPLGCYYLAIMGSAFGFSEHVLHAAMLLPAWAALFGTYCLAVRLGARPMPAALLTLTTPAFVLCGVSVMCDVPLLALWLWTIIAWDIGLRQRRTGWLIVAGLLIALTTLTKYFGVCLIPLLAAYSLAVDRPGWRRWLVPLVIGVAILAGYQILTWQMYGKGLLGGAMGYAVSFGPPTVGSAIFRLFASLTFLGGCVGVAAIAVPFLVGRRGRLLLAAAGAVTLALALFLNSKTQIDGVDWSDSPFALNSENAYCRPDFDVTGQVANFAGLVFQFTTWTVLGCGLLLLTWQDWRRERDPTALLLLLWVAGTFAFAAFVNWALNGRSILPLVPAIAIILVRRLQQTWSGSWSPWLLPSLLLPAAAISIAVAIADTLAANAQRTAAGRIVPATAAGSRPLWISGHWSWQYYAMEQGGQPWDGRNERGRPGDAIIVPENNCNLAPIRWEMIEHEMVEIPAASWCSTMNVAVGAGYYADVWGPMPFAFGDIAPERYSIRRLERRK